MGNGSSGATSQASPEQCRVFICYRQDDGMETAAWLFEALEGKTLPAISGQSGARTLSIYFDKAAAAVGDWRSIHQPSLETAKAFFIICTPGTYARQGHEDWVHREIDWWLSNRGSPPILIEPGRGDGRWVPESIRRRWPQAQRVNLDLEKYKNSDVEARGRLKQQVVTQITHGVTLGASRVLFEELEHYKRSNRIIRSVSIGLGVSLVMSGLLSLWVTKEKAKVVEERKVAVAKQLAAQALLEINRHFDLALLLSAHAEKLDPDSDTRSSLLSVMQRINGDARFLWGQQDVIKKIAISGNRWLAGALYDGTVMLWDLKKPEQSGRLLCKEENEFNTLAFNPDGSLLAAGGGGGVALESGLDCRIYVYDMERDELLGTPLVGHTNAVRNLAFSSRGDFLASADDAGNVILWERTSQKRGNFSYQTNLVVSCIVSPGGLNFTPDDDLLVACDDGIKKFDIRHPGSEVENLRLAEASELKRIAFCWRNYIAAEMFETNIVLWDLKRQAEVADFRLDSMPDVKGDNMQALALSEDSDLVAVANGNSVGLWDVNSRQWRTKSMRMHGDSILDLMFAFGSDQLVTSGNDSRLIVWDLPGEDLLKEKQFRIDGTIVRIAVDTNSGQLAYTTETQVGFVDIATKALRNESLPNDSYFGSALAYSRDGKILATGSSTNGIQLWRTSDLEPIGQPLIAHRNFVQCVAFSPDGKQLASGGDNQVILWDLGKNPPRPETIYRHKGPVFDVAFSLNGKFLATGSADHSVGFYDLVARRLIAMRSDEHRESVTRIAFSPEGDLLASASDDATVGIWKVGKECVWLRRLSGAQGFASSVAFNADGSILASGGGTGLIRFWRTGSWTPLSAALEPSTAVQWCLRYQPDGTNLISADADGNIVFWNLDATTWAAQARRVANRELTGEEIKDYFGDLPYKPLLDLVGHE